MDGSTTAGTVKSGQYEMMLLLEWEARIRCIEF